jgi:hypothetical protein
MTSTRDKRQQEVIHLLALALLLLASCILLELHPVVLAVAVFSSIELLRLPEEICRNLVLGCCSRYKISELERH